MAKSIKRNNAKYNCQAQSTFHTYVWIKRGSNFIFRGGGCKKTDTHKHQTYNITLSLIFYFLLFYVLSFFFFIVFLFLIFLFLKIQAPYDTVRNPHLCSTSYNIGDNRTFWPLVCDDAS